MRGIYPMPGCRNLLLSVWRLSRYLLARQCRCRCFANLKSGVWKETEEMEDRLRRMSEIDIMDIDLQTVATFDEASKISASNPSEVAEAFCKKGLKRITRL